MSAVGRSLTALQTWVSSMRAYGQQRGDSELMSVTWSFTFQAEEDATATGIDESEFFATTENPVGRHPRAGKYTATATNPETGLVVLEESGVCLPTEDDKTPGTPEASLAGLIKSATGLGAQMLSSSACEVAKANRRASQAEEREDRLRTKLSATADALEGMRSELLSMRMERDRERVDREAMQAERDAAIADIEEIRAQGGELAELAQRGVDRAWDRAQEVLAPDPFRLVLDAAREETCLCLLGQTVTLPDGRVCMMALVLHHLHGLPWGPLRVLIFALCGEDFPTAPPIDWQLPEEPEEVATETETAEPAREEMH